MATNRQLPADRGGAQLEGGTGGVILFGRNATTGEEVHQMADLDYFTWLLLSLFCHCIFMCA